MQNVIQLQETITSLEQKIDEKDKILEQKNHYIVQLEDALKQQRQTLFGASSEKASADQLGLFNEAEDLEQEEIDAEDKAVTVASHIRQKKPRVSIPADLPREEIVYDLNESDKTCPHDGSELKVIGSDDHEQLDIIPAQVKVIRHKRLKYACPCCNQHIVTAKKPKQPIEKSIASPGLLAFVATQKYCDALPLYRQSEIFKRLGIELDRSNLANWMIKSGELVQPLINLLRDHLLERPLVHMDETTVQVLNEPDKKAQSKSYMWLMASFTDKPITLFHYDPTRRQQVPIDLLDSSVSTLMIDGYEWYQKACDDYTIKRLGCWAHARRKFIEAKKIQPKASAPAHAPYLRPVGKGKTGKADQALAWIQKLYLIEKKIKDDPPERRYQIRQQQAKPIINNIEEWLQKSVLHVPPKTALGKALQYLHNQWDRLIGYLDDGTYPIDNNLAENAIRPFAVGRKNWLFSNSQAGAKASANLYSLIQTAKANNLNPYEYLKTIFKELPNAQSVEDVENLLPWNVPKNRAG
jgi:transposase